MSLSKHIMNPMEKIPETTTIGNKRYALVLFHSGPNDPIATAEVLQLSYYKHEFDAIGCDVIATSSNSKKTIKDWVKNTLSNTGLFNAIGIVADPLDNAAQDFGVIQIGKKGAYDANAVFIIDGNQNVRYHSVLYNNVAHAKDEYLRIVKALKETDTGDKLAPTDWESDIHTVNANSDSIKDFFKTTWKTRGIEYTGMENLYNVGREEYSKIMKRLIVDEEQKEETPASREGETRDPFIKSLICRFLAFFPGLRYRYQCGNKI